MTRIEQNLKALEFFKDWSNYMLVTTVAALGWLAEGGQDTNGFAIVCLAISALLGIGTLALIPVIAGQLRDRDPSFYDIEAKCKLVWMCGPSIPMKVKYVCWPQHVSFMLGIGEYAVWHVFCR